MLHSNRLLVKDGLIIIDTFNRNLFTTKLRKEGLICKAEFRMRAIKILIIKM